MISGMSWKDRAEPLLRETLSEQTRKEGAREGEEEETEPRK